MSEDPTAPLNYDVSGAWKETQNCDHPCKGRGIRESAGRSPKRWLQEAMIGMPMGRQVLVPVSHRLFSTGLKGRLQLLQASWPLLYKLSYLRQISMAFLFLFI